MATGPPPTPILLAPVLPRWKPWGGPLDAKTVPGPAAVRLAIRWWSTQQGRIVGRTARHLVDMVAHENDPAFVMAAEDALLDGLADPYDLVRFRQGMVHWHALLSAGIEPAVILVARGSALSEDDLATLASCGMTPTEARTLLDAGPLDLDALRALAALRVGSDRHP